MTRPNSKRSGGPKTDIGKVVAASNSLKAGSYSLNAVVLPGEDGDAFNELHEQFVRDFAPRDIAEASMVRDLAVLTWKKMRLERIEHSAMIRELNKRFENFEFYSARLLTADTAENIRQLGADVEAHGLAFNKATELMEAELSDEVIPLLKDEFPLIFESVEFLAREGLAQEIPLEKWLVQTVTRKSGEKLSFLKFALQQFLARYPDMEEAFEDLEQAQAEIRSAMEQRLLKFMDGRLKHRARDDLDRSFYRTLSELRRHQAWRRSMSEITVNPEHKSAGVGESSS